MPFRDRPGVSEAFSQGSDYAIVPVGGLYVAFDRSGNENFPNADPGVVINNAAAALTAAQGGGIGMVGSLSTAVPVILKPGVALLGTGFRPVNDSPFPCSLKATATLSASIAVTAASWVGGVVTLTLAFDPVFAVVGQIFSVNAINPAGFNGSFVAASVNHGTKQITYALATNPGAYVSGGSVPSGGVLLSLDTASEVHNVDIDGNNQARLAVATIGNHASIRHFSFRNGQTCAFEVQAGQVYASDFQISQEDFQVGTALHIIPEDSVWIEGRVRGCGTNFGDHVCLLDGGNVHMVGVAYVITGGPSGPEACFEQTGGKDVRYIDCSFGHTRGGVPGNVFKVSGAGEFDATSCRFRSDNLANDNQSDAIQIKGAGRKADFFGGVISVGGNPNSFRYAMTITGGGSGFVRVQGVQMEAATNPWDNAPTQHSGNTYNGALID